LETLATGEFQCFNSGKQCGSAETLNKRKEGFAENVARNGDDEAPSQAV